MGTTVNWPIVSASENRPLSRRFQSVRVSLLDSGQVGVYGRHDGASLVGSIQIPAEAVTAERVTFDPATVPCLPTSQLCVCTGRTWPFPSQEAASIGFALLASRV